MDQSYLFFIKKEHPQPYYALRGGQVLSRTYQDKNKQT